MDGFQINVSSKFSHTTSPHLKESCICHCLDLSPGVGESVPNGNARKLEDRRFGMQREPPPVAELPPAAWKQSRGPGAHRYVTRAGEHHCDAHVCC